MLRHIGHIFFNHVLMKDPCRQYKITSGEAKGGSFARICISTTPIGAPIYIWPGVCVSVCVCLCVCVSVCVCVCVCVCVRGVG